MTASATSPGRPIARASDLLPAAPHDSASPAANFLRHVVEHDLAHGAYAARLGVPHWVTANGPYEVDRAMFADPARVRTRFPPEPNGYLHIGHAKSICLNFGLANDYDGVCHLRFDDTNPEKEDVEYVDAIIEMVRWLRFDWQARDFERAVDASIDEHLYFASGYFDLLYEFAEYLISTGHAYVDSQSADEIRAMRGTLVEPGRDSPHRERSVDDNLALFRMMRAGDFADGAHVLRAKIDMASPNINLRDPVLYRIRHARHHRTGDAWCIYPMYDYTHCVSDALENITHSVCTLEFEDHRPLYDWSLERIVPVLRAPQFIHAIDLVRNLAARGADAREAFARRCLHFETKLFASPEERDMRTMFERWKREPAALAADAEAFFELLLDSPGQFAPLLTHALDTERDGGEKEGNGVASIGASNPFGLPHQYEFSRLNLTYVVTSKRKLKQLVDEGLVDGWDDPRMPTLVGLRRRGYSPGSIRLFCDRMGVSKSNSWTDYSELEQALRDDLDPVAARAFAILDPLRLVVTNYPADRSDLCTAPVHPHAPDRGQRRFPFARDVWIERDDFQEAPQKGFFRLYPPTDGKPGNVVRLKYGYVVRCTGFTTDPAGRVVEVTCEYLPETFSGTPGADAVKVKGNIAWIAVAHARAAEVRLYDRLFTAPQPDAGGRDFLQSLNPASKRTVEAFVEPGTDASQGASYQFERLGYFVADREDSTQARPVFNRSATLRDTWQR